MKNNANQIHPGEYLLASVASATVDHSRLGLTWAIFLLHFSFAVFQSETENKNKQKNGSVK